MAPVVLELAGVRVSYAATDALDVPGLEVREGEVLALIGPNGSGKSRLLRVLGLLERPTRGTVSFRGRVVDAGGALHARRRVAVVLQQPLLADLTVAGNGTLGLSFRRVTADECESRLGRWLERLNIAPLRDQRARTLSGGEAQRVALARALVLEPDVLLLDEPFSGLDEPSRAALLPDLAAILRADRVTTVLVSHDRGEALALADRVAVLMGGRIRQLDETARVFHAPVSGEVVDVGFPLVATVTARSVADLGLAEGVTITAVFKASAAHLVGPRSLVAGSARPP